MKKVLLIGDSIRLGYQDDVIEELKGEYEVWGPPENCRFAKFTLNELGRWIQDCAKNSKTEYDEALLTPGAGISEQEVYPDIIYWNNGLWDTSIVYEEDGPFTPIPEYITYMSKILREFRKITDKVIFATTTPVKPINPNQKNDIITEYNKAIVEFMENENVVISDLNKLVSENIDEYISPDNIHLSAEGKKACAKVIAECIRKVDRNG